MRRNRSSTGRKRVSKQLEKKKNYLIVTEGVTEVNYFNMLKRRYRANVEVKTLQSKKTDALGVVNVTINQPNFSTYTKAYSIFDKDQNTIQQLQQANSLATRHNIQIGFSNPSFDLWLLAHFQVIQKNHYMQPSIYKQLSSHYGVPKYEDLKADNTICDKIASFTERAIDHCKPISTLESGINYQQNPFCNIPQIVEEVFQVSNFKSRYN